MKRKGTATGLLLLVSLLLGCLLLPLRAEGASLGYLRAPASDVSDISSMITSSDSVDSGASSAPPPSLPEEKDGIYSIDTPEQWNRWALQVNTGVIATKGKTFTLTADLNFGSETTLMPVGTEEHPFSGRFSGEGHRLYGIRGVVTKSMGTASPFGYLKDAALTNFGVETVGGGLDGDMYAAGIASVVLGRTKIEGCYFAGALSGKITGGLVADMRGQVTLTDCYAVVLSDSAKTTSKNADNSGILVGRLLDLPSGNASLTAHTVYGISPDCSVYELFGTPQHKGIHAKTALLFDINSPLIQEQMSEETLSETFNFGSVWQLPDGALPLLKWQKKASAEQTQYSYMLEGDDPVAITDRKSAVKLNTGALRLVLEAKRGDGLSIYSNVTREADGRYAVSLPRTGEPVLCAFAALKNGQLSLETLSFIKTDANLFKGYVRGLKNEETYTVMLTRTDRPGIRFSDTFVFDAWNKVAFHFSSVPEGMYDLTVTAAGYLKEERKGIEISSKTAGESPNITLYRAIENVYIQNIDQRRVEPGSVNRMEVTLLPIEGAVNTRRAEVLLSGRKAPEEAYTLEWQGNDIVFVPQRSGEFILRVHIFDAHGTPHIRETTLNVYRRVTNITLPQSVEIVSMDKPLELVPKIQPADATETKLTWTILEGADCISIVPDGMNCKLMPQKVGMAIVLAECIDGLSHTVRVRVLDNTPPVFGELSFEKTAAMDRMMCSFDVVDDCDVARVSIFSQAGDPVSVSRMASQKNGFAFEAEVGVEYSIEAMDINGNVAHNTVKPDDQPQLLFSITNSGLAVSKSTDSISLWVSTTDLTNATYEWQKREEDGWEVISGGVSKMTEGGLLPNTWYEYRVMIKDETGGETIKTAAVRTNAVPIQPEDIVISAGSSYHSVYVGESFPLVSLIDGEVDVTGQESQWSYDQDALTPVSPGSPFVVAKEPGRHILECTQTDVYGQTARQTFVLEVRLFERFSGVYDTRFLLMTWMMSISFLGLFIIWVWRGQRARAKLK